MLVGKIIFVFFLSVCLVSVARAEWRKQRSGSLAWLYAVQFPDASTGFAAGSNGTLLATYDGGMEWKKLPLPITDTIRDVHFFDSSTGWMLCDRGKIRSAGNASYLLRTADGGKSWSVVEFRHSPERFSRLFFGSNGSGYLVGERGVMAGLPSAEKETRAFLPIKFLMADGVALDDRRILLTGGGGSLISSDDGGRSWHSPRFIGVRPESKLNAVYFVDGHFGWIAGNGGLIFSTADGGESWAAQKPDTKADLLDIAFHGRESGFAVGDGGVVLRTSDAGASWAIEDSGSKHRLERLAFAGRRAIAVGFGGTIISTDLP